MISRLTLTNFRSYRLFTAEFSPSATVIVGPNGSGKTNILEALYVLATTKSFRAKDTELVTHNSDPRYFRLVAKVGDDELALGYQEADTTTKRAGRNQTKLSLNDHIGQLQVVLFEPNNILLAYGSPEHRRNYLDTALIQTDAGYRKTTQAYRRVLRQRNQVLADWRGQPSDLFAWNLQLAELAGTIYHRRQQLIHALNQQLDSRYEQIAGKPQRLLLSYRSMITVDDPADYTSSFLVALEACQARDIGAGFTTIGAHRDDMEISFNGGAITDRASRGELRTAVLVLKLAELDYIEASTGRTALLLLDDVFSELDAGRRQRLIAALGVRQTIITTTDADHISGELGPDMKLIHTKPEKPRAKRSK